MAENAADPQAKLWNKSYITLLLLGVITGTASQVVTPLISKYISSFGASLTLAGTVTSIMSFVALLCRPFSGVASDRFNRKTIMTVSVGVTALAVGAYAIAPNIGSFVAFRIIHGVAFSFMGVANMAFAASFIPRERFGEGMGYIGLSAILSQAVGPSAGLWLVENYSYSACFLVSAGFSALACVILLCLKFKYVPVQMEKRKKIHFDNLFAKELLMYGLFLGLFSTGNGMITSLLAMLGDARGISNVALFFTVYSITVVAVRPMSGKLLDKKGLKIILFPSFVIAAAGMVFLGAAKTLTFVIIAAVLKALGQGAAAPSIQAYAVKQLGPERAGVASSTCYIFQDLGNTVGPIVGGFTADKIGFGNTFYSYAALLFSGVFMYMAKLRYDKKEAESTIPVESIAADKGSSDLSGVEGE